MQGPGVIGAARCRARRPGAPPEVCPLPIPWSRLPEKDEGCFAPGRGTFHGWKVPKDPRVVVVANSAALRTPRRGHPSLRSLAPPLPTTTTTLGRGWVPGGSAPYDFPDPKRTFGKRSKFVRRGHELGAAAFSARCRSCRSNQAVFLFQYCASHVPCLFGSIWLESPPTMHNIRFSHSVGPDALIGPQAATWGGPYGDYGTVHAVGRPAFLRCFTVGQGLCPCRIGPMRASGPTKYHHIVPARRS